MTAVGGFFGLEPVAPGHTVAWHDNAAALTSGRACLRAILEIAQPSMVLLPFYICDAALAPLHALGIPLQFYGLTPSLDPDVRDWPGNVAVIAVNYFDLKSARADSIASELGPRAIVDDTQAFFRKARGLAWSFNSARKFFGVPDGGYVYGPRASNIKPSVVNDAMSEHLTTRVHGDQDLAYRQYVAAEVRVSSDVLAPSPLSGRLLGGIAYEGAREARRRNFAQLHHSLAARNTLAVDLTLDDDAAPFCYPFLPAQPSLHEALWRREIFVPRLWPEIPNRTAGGFQWERDFASRLLPLPVDHRYGADDMTRVANAVLEVAA